jgi:hypothetical protein
LFDRQIAAAWVPAETLPTDVRRINYETDLNADQQQAFDAKNIHDRLNPNALFLHKDKKLIYPELRVTQKLSFDSKSRHAGDKQPPKKLFSDLDLQTWYYNKVKTIQSILSLRHSSSLTRMVGSTISSSLRWP